MNKAIIYSSILITLSSIYSPTILAKPSLFELESRIIKLENKLHNNLNLEMANKLDTLQLEIQELRGIIEEQQNLLTKININTNLVNAPMSQDKNASLTINKDQLGEHTLEYERFHHVEQSNSIMKEDNQKDHNNKNSNQTTN